MTDLPLISLRIIDLTDDRGALCGRILADLGAEVIRVVHDHAELDRTDGAHRFRNANKTLMVADLDDPADLARVDELLAGADVVIENLGPIRAPVHGFDHDALAARHPHLIHVALTDLGLTGPRSGWHLEPLPAFAASGALWASGFPDGEPCWLPGFIAHDCASVHGALGAVAAVIDRRTHGVGQLVEVSTQEAALAGTTPWSIAMPSYLDVMPLWPVEGRRNAEGTYLVLPASDGWVRCVFGHVAHWESFVELLGRPDALVGDESHEATFRIINADVIRVVAGDILRQRSRADLAAYGVDNDLPIGPVHALSEFVGHEQTHRRGYFGRTAGGALVGTAPWQLDGEPVPPPADPVELLGAAVPADRHPDLEAGGSGEQLPLTGIRVIEFGVAALVPELCWMLSELGADIIKVEAANHPDPLRQMGMGQPDRAFGYNTECRGRRTASIDISTPEGRDLVLELCAAADVIAENNRGGVMARHGLDLDSIRAANPDIIHVTSQGFGNSGPLATQGAFGPVNASFSGTHLLWNHPDSPYPCGTSLNHPDHIAGKLLGVAVLAALDHRSRTGETVAIDLAQAETAAYLIGHLFVDADATGIDPGPAGNRSERAVPHDVYRSGPVDGDHDRWVAVAVTDDDGWARLETLCGFDHEPELAHLEGRLAHRDRIDERLRAWLADLTDEEAATRLQAAGISAMPVMGPLAQLADRHLEARHAILTLDNPRHGEERQLANPTRLSRVPLRVAGPAPALDGHTDEILREVLGKNENEIAALRAAGACPTAALSRLLTPRSTQVV